MSAPRPTELRWVAPALGEAVVALILFVGNHDWISVASAAIFIAVALVEVGARTARSSR